MEEDFKEEYGQVGKCPESPPGISGGQWVDVDGSM